MQEDQKTKRLKELSKETVDVTQHKATEAPFSGKYVSEHADGSYHCIVCGQKLFESGTKFDSGSGWPSFDDAVPGSVLLQPDHSHGMSRTEVVCSNCGAHLGHVFDDGPTHTTGKRYCINSCALNLEKK